MTEEATGTPDVLLVSTVAVRDRLADLNGSPPAWQEVGAVSDLDLRSAPKIRLVHEMRDTDTRWAFLQRIEGLGFRTGDGRWETRTVESIEAAAARMRATEADKQAEADTFAERQERARRKARRMVDAEELAELDRAPVVATFAEEASLPVAVEPWVVSGLVHDQGRVVVGGFRKAGKTVLVLNLAQALVTGEDFLDRFAVRKPDPDRSVMWLNMELTQGQARHWVHALAGWTDTSALERLVAVHLRGAVSHYAVTTSTGADALVRLLVEHRVETLMLDPVAPMMAVCGLSSLDERDVGQFLHAVNRIADRASVGQVIYTAHVGKASARDEGFETVKGDTRWEDAADSIIILGKEPNSGSRWIRAEGRDVALDNHTLVFDEDSKRLRVTAVSRYEMEIRACAEQVLQVVRALPGIQTEALLGDVRIVGTKAKRKAGRDEAIRLGWIRKAAGHGTAVEHWPLV